MFILMYNSYLKRRNISWQNKQLNIFQQKSFHFCTFDLGMSRYSKNSHKHFFINRYRYKGYICGKYFHCYLSHQKWPITIWTKHIIKREKLVFNTLTKFLLETATCSKQLIKPSPGAQSGTHPVNIKTAKWIIIWSLIFLHPC